MNKKIEYGDKLIIGKKQVIKGITEKKFSKVLIAANNDSHFKNEIVKKCELNGIEYDICLSKEELGILCNIDVPCGVVGIEHKN